MMHFLHMKPAGSSKTLTIRFKTVINHKIHVYVITNHKRTRGHEVAQLVEALRYKSEGRRLDSRSCHRNFPLT